MGQQQLFAPQAFTDTMEVEFEKQFLIKKFFEV